MSARLSLLACREDDCRSVMGAQLMCDTNPGTGHLEIDIYERDVRSLAASQLQGFGRRVRGPEYGKASLLEYRRGTVGNDDLIFDDQYNHTNTSNKRRRGFLTAARPKITDA